MPTTKQKAKAAGAKAVDHRAAIIAQRQARAVQAAVENEPLASGSVSVAEGNGNVYSCHLYCILIIGYRRGTWPNPESSMVTDLRYK